MRAFDVNAAAIALDVTPKWLDNLLSHHDIPGVIGGRQGVRRRLQPRSILLIAIAARLVHELGSPMHRALHAAGHLVADGRFTGDLGFELRLDVAGLSREIEARLSEAAEVATLRRRGRPPVVSGSRSAIPESPAQP